MLHFVSKVLNDTRRKGFHCAGVCFFGMNKIISAIEEEFK